MSAFARYPVAEHGFKTHSLSLSLSLSLSHLRIVDSTPNPLDEAKIENFCAACVLTLKNQQQRKTVSERN